MQKPSIGRIVHLSHSGQRVAAVVTHVWSETCVNVQPLGPKAGTSEITSAVYEEETTVPEDPNMIGIAHHRWTWPPRTL